MGAEPVSQKAAWATGALVALLLLLPPDTHPWVAPIALALCSGLLASQRLALPQGSGLLLLFGGFSALSIAWSACPGPGIELGLRWVLAGLIYLLAAAAPRDSLVAMAAPVALFHGAFAAEQRFLELPALVGQLERGRSEFEDRVLERATSGRAFSTFALPAHLGAVLAALTPILLSELVGGATRRRRVLAGAGLFGVVLGLGSSLALGGAVALALVSAAALMLRGRVAPARRAAAWGALLALPVLILLGRAGDFSGLDSWRNPLSSRLRLWRRACDVIATAPVAGRGLGSYQVTWLPFARADDVPARNAHMSYLEVAGEVGLPALALLVLFFAVTLSRTRAPAIRLGLAVLLVHAAADFDLQSPGLLVATLALAGASRGTEGRGPVSRHARLALGVVALAAAAAGALREAARAQHPGWPAPSRAVLERAVARWPFAVQERGAIARLQLDAGELDGALDQVRRARRIEPETAWLAALEGDVHVVRGEAFAAYSAYHEATVLYPAREAYQRRASEVLQSIETGRPKRGGS